MRLVGAKRDLAFMETTLYIKINSIWLDPSCGEVYTYFPAPPRIIVNSFLPTELRQIHVFWLQDGLS